MPCSPAWPRNEGAGVLLSELPLSPPLGESLRLVRDGRFRALGFLDHPAEDLLVALYQRRYLDLLIGSPCITCVISSEALAERIPPALGVLVADDPKRALYDLHDYLFHHTAFYGADAPTRIAESARVHPAAYVAPRGVSIGPGAIIEPNATILERTRVGQDAVIRAGSVIGAEGFGVRRVGSHQVPVPHAGFVDIGAGVQILSNCTIVRATFGGATMIGDETVINAQSYVAHHARIGKRCRIAAGAVVAGSAQLGDDVWIGPNAVVANGVRVGDGAWVGLGSVVIRDVPSGERVSGHFAMPHRKFLRFLARAQDDVQP
jgi:UDP-3-O-[3-hydroxymyristoyl] glucosamine N-acyltransferase